MVVDFPDSGLVAGVTEHVHPQTGTIFLWTGSVWVVKGTANTNVQGGLPVGAIVSHSSQTIPPGYFECAGQSLVITAYPQLYEAIGTYWGQGDDPGNTFALPNFRGQFLRGWDNGEGVDPSREWASFQDDMFESHTHGIAAVLPAASGSNAGEIPGTGTGILSGATGGSETRPKNYAVMFIIKAYDTVLNPGMVDVSVLAQFIANSQSQAEYLDAANGYLVLPDWLGGFIVNWGTTNVQFDSGADAPDHPTVTFAKPYNVACFNIQTTVSDTIERNSPSAAYASNITLEDFILTGDPGDNLGLTLPVFWFAIGK